jgi:hypothetical protein
MLDVLRWIIAGNVFEIILQQQNAQCNLDLIRSKESAGTSVLALSHLVSKRRNPICEATHTKAEAHLIGCRSAEQMLALFSGPFS